MSGDNFVPRRHKWGPAPECHLSAVRVEQVQRVGFDRNPMGAFLGRGCKQNSTTSSYILIPVNPSQKNKANSVKVYRRLEEMSYVFR
jgi:hypothetical protein